MKHQLNIDDAWIIVLRNPDEVDKRYVSLSIKATDSAFSAYTQKGTSAQGIMQMALADADLARQLPTLMKGNIYLEVVEA